jgi:LytS/YehU family sensor histidine kinase
MVAASNRSIRSAPPPFWLVVAGAWAVFGVLYGVVWSATVREPTRALLWTLPTAMAVAATWAALTPLVFRLTRRVAPARVGWLVSLASHTGAVVACSALLTAILRASMARFAAWSPEPYVPMVFYWFDVWLFTYASLVVVGHALVVRRRYVDRTVRAHLLEAQLARAQLQYLELQLQPHFLFNALNAISELAHESPVTAERMLRRLHALLAVSLERSGRDEVTLEEELAALSPYLDIQRIRFSDWLQVGMEVPPSVRQALVPHLILQPLVENAIRHGLSVRPAPGAVLVSAERLGDRLVLRVEDDGVGLRPRPQPEASERREGIGLRNASERLRQLYGADHRFELRAARSGGVVVELEIPYREGDTTMASAEWARLTASYSLQPGPAAAPGTPGAPLVAASYDDPTTWRTGEFSTVAAELLERPVAPAEQERADVAPVPQWQESGSFRAARRPVPATVAQEPARATAPPAAPDLTPRTWLGIVGLWAALAVLWTNQMVLYTNAVRPNDGYGWVELARLQVASSIIWIALCPVVVALARRFRMDATNWGRRLPLHAVFGVAVGIIHTGAMQLSGLSQLPVLSPANMNPLTGDFFVYFGLLAWSHARDFVSWYRAREVEGARLSARIAGSRFQALRVQLRPQFLLSTLDLLAELVHRDVPRAERLIIRLADMLRLTLESGREATTTLKEELDLLHACVETHRLGIRPDVQLQVSVPADMLGSAIPSRLLCSMVDDLLGADTLNPGEPLTVRLEVERMADVTRLKLRGEAAWVGRAGGSHAWWRTKSVAEAAVADAGPLVSVTFPDRATAVLLVADPGTVPESAGQSPARASMAAAVA